jgi:hypothetical protein
MEIDKLKLAFYYLNGITLYWHQNLIRSKESQVISNNLE